MADSTSLQADLASNLLEIIPELFRQLRAEVPQNTDQEHSSPEWRDIIELGTTNGQFRLIRILMRNERCTMQQLATQLHVTPPTATAMIKRLLTHGYVERLRDEEDWRMVRVQATERGKRALTLYDHIRHTSLQRRLAHLSAEELANLQAALPVFRHLIEVK
jgi:MarR family transcriptional regulator, organic hydroperoxide resistance regulator